MSFRFKVENAFLGSLEKSQFLVGNVHFKILFIFLFSFPLKLVDKWNYVYTWEDLSTNRTVVLDLVRKYLQKYFIWSEDYLRIISLFTYIVFSEFANRVVNVCVGGSLNVS